MIWSSGSLSLRDDRVPPVSLGSNEMLHPLPKDGGAALSSGTRKAIYTDLSRVPKDVTSVPECTSHKGAKTNDYNGKKIAIQVYLHVMYYTWYIVLLLSMQINCSG